MKKQFAVFMIPIVIGLVGGYTILNPVSSLIIHVFEENVYDISHIVAEAFSPLHLIMAIFFALIGGVIGLIFSLYSIHLRKINYYLSKINMELDRRCSALMEKTHRNSPKISSVVRGIRPFLSRVKDGIELIAEESVGSINMRQSTLLTITKENVENLFQVIEYLVETDQTTFTKNDNIAEQEPDSKQFM